MLIDSVAWWDKEIGKVFARADALEKKLSKPGLSGENEEKILKKMEKVERELSLLLARSTIENGNMIAFEKKFKNFLSE